MVRPMAPRYRRTPLGAEDALGVGAVALVEAARRYDPSHEVPFAGFAFRRVKGAMEVACSGRSGARGGGRKSRRRATPTCWAKWSATCARRGPTDISTCMPRSAGCAPPRTIVEQHACGVPHHRIARDLGVTESRVSQLLGVARQRLRAEVGMS